MRGWYASERARMNRCESERAVSTSTTRPRAARAWKVVQCPAIPWPLFTRTDAKGDENEFELFASWREGEGEHLIAPRDFDVVDALYLTIESEVPTRQAEHAGVRHTRASMCECGEKQWRGRGLY